MPEASVAFIAAVIVGVAAAAMLGAWPLDVWVAAARSGGGRRDRGLTMLQLRHARAARLPAALGAALTRTAYIVALRVIIVRSKSAAFARAPMTVMTAIRSAETEEAKTAADRIERGPRPASRRCRSWPRFFDALFASAVPDDVLRARADQLAALAMALSAKTTRASPGQAWSSALDQGHETVLVGINDDRPFLFDSALQAAMAGGARIRAAFHPIIEI